MSETERKLSVLIYVTEEQDTVLGNETVAKEMIVNVLDKMRDMQLWKKPSPEM